MLPTADALIEDLYDFLFKQCPEKHRVDTARTALLAAQFRARQLEQQRLQRAIAKRGSERKALLDSVQRAGGDDCPPDPSVGNHAC